jgi:hypothetical protein
MTYNVIAEGARRRAGRREPLYLGTVEAGSRQDAERLVRERWPQYPQLSVVPPCDPHGHAVTSRRP